MADPRLLKTVPILCVVLLLLLGCQLYAPRVAGRVVDAQSGEGIEGVTVFRTVTFYDRLGGLTGRPVFNSTGSVWATTAADGSFEIPAAPLGVRKPLFRLKGKPPALTWVHPEYGWGDFYEREADLDRMEIRAERDPAKLEQMRGTRGVYASDNTCSFYEAEPSDYCCEVAFGSVDRCL